MFSCSIWWMTRPASPVTRIGTGRGACPRVIASIRGRHHRDGNLAAGRPVGDGDGNRPGFDGAAKAQADASDPDIIAWETMMDAMQRRIPGHDGKWIAATRIFDLAQH
jgi:hypothetical protein